MCLISLRSPFGVQREIYTTERRRRSKPSEARPSCVDGWVGGWMGCDILPPSIFLIFKYDNKQHVLIPKMCLKVAYAF